MRKKVKGEGRERDEPCVDFAEAGSDDRRSSVGKIVLQPLLELGKVEADKMTLLLELRFAQVDDVPPPDSSQRRRFPHARMRIGNKDIDVDAAESVLSHAPSFEPLRPLDTADGPLATTRDAEDVRGCSSGCEGVLGEDGGRKFE